MQSILLYPSCAISILHIAHCTSSTIALCILHIVHCNQHNWTWCRWKLYEFHWQISAHSAIWVQVGSAVQNGKRQLNNQLTSVSNCKTICEGCEEELVKEHIKSSCWKVSSRSLKTRRVLKNTELLKVCLRNFFTFSFFWLFALISSSWYKAF